MAVCFYINSKTSKKNVTRTERSVDFQPQLFLSDFEQSTMNAYEEEFPGIIIKGCHFHMTQSLWRKNQELEFNPRIKIQEINLFDVKSGN